MTWGICDTECGPLSDLLSGCSLPPYSPVWDRSSELRNLTGLPPAWSHQAGPNTYHVANYAQANCFCHDAPAEIISCLDCHGLNWDGGEMPFLDILDGMYHDCTEFGYFDNSTLSYPSTTVSSMPKTTQFTDSSGSDACIDTCGVLGGQIAECDLIPLGVDKLPSPKEVPLGRGVYHATLLFDRASAECVCTLPVMRRMAACGECQKSHAEGMTMPLFTDYVVECNKMGYWTDSEWIVPETEDDDGPTFILTTSTGSATSADSADGACPDSVGLISVSIVMTSLLFLSQGF